jgi:hypothetical protein
VIHAAVPGRQSLPEGILLSIRPEAMRIVPPASARPGANRIGAQVLESTFLGEASEHLVLANEQRLRIVCTPPIFSIPQTITAEFDPADVIILPQ